MSGGGRARCLRGSRLELDEMPTTKSPGQAAGKMPRQRPRWGRRRENHRGRRRARSEMPAGAEAGLAAGSERDAGGGRGWAGSGQMLGVPRLGSEWPGTGRDAGGPESGGSRT